MVHTKLIKEISLTNEILKKSMEENYDLWETKSVREHWSTVGNSPAPSLSEGVEIFITVNGFMCTMHGSNHHIVPQKVYKCYISMEKTMI